MHIYQWQLSISTCSPTSTSSILVEPAKLYFLNNAINHGVFTAVTNQAAKAGQSILYTQ